MSVSQPSASKRAPLREMPLDLFVAPQPRSIKTNIFGASPSSRPNKRPHSPGDVGMYSPAKRRIMEVEGIISPQKMKSPSSSAAAKSPFSSAKSPFSSAKSPISSAYRNLYSAATAKFADALIGPDSPAKKLDFSAACEEDEERRSTSALSTSRSGMRTPKASPAQLAPSPKMELAALSPKMTLAAPSPKVKLAAPSPGSKLARASSPDDCEMTDYFASPGPSPDLFASRGPSFDRVRGPSLDRDPASLHPVRASVGPSPAPATAGPLPAPAPLYLPSANIRHIPRVPPPPIDATSIHNPGFQIHLDEFEVVVDAQEGGLTYINAQDGGPTCNGSQDGRPSLAPTMSNKENVPAPRRASLKDLGLKRSSTDPIPELTALLFSPEGKKSVLSVPDRASSMPSMLRSSSPSMLGSPARAKGPTLPAMTKSPSLPAREKGKRREGSLTPKACSGLAREVRASPAREVRPSPAQRKERRRMLEDEVDAMEEDDDCEGVFL